MSVQLLCQLFKFIAYSIRDRKLSPRYLVTAGGIPSSHSAFVSSLCTYLALSNGTQGPWFSVSMVFGLIVAYDAYRLRGHVQKHAVAINALQKEVPASSDAEPLTEMVGHSLPQIGIGLLLGVLHSWLLWSIFG